MKNVCFFNSIAFWGGGEKLHLEYALGFKKRNYRVFLASKKNTPLAIKGAKELLPVFFISAGNISFLNPFKILKLYWFYKKENIDTVIFSTSQDVKLGSIAAKIAGVQKIVYLRGLAVPIKASWINKYIFKSVLTHIVANSDETKNKILCNLGSYFDHEKICTIYHGIETKLVLQPEIKKLPIIGEKGKGMILGNAGRLTPQKGQEDLLKIAKKLKEKSIDFTLFIAGTGELKASLEKQIQQLDLTNEVILLSFVEDMTSFMQSIDIFLLTSKWEGFGYVLVEAMIQNCPVVAYDISSNPEIVSHNKTGFLVTLNDIETFALRTSELIQNSDLRSSMGVAAKQSVLDRFDLDDRIAEFEQYLLRYN